MNKRKTKAQSGITLVALIITIIVLIILAIVSIRAIQQGGILTKAGTAKEAYSEAEEKEKIELAKAEALMDAYPNDGGVIKKANLDAALAKQFGDGEFESEESNGNFVITIKASSRQYKVTSKGNVTNYQPWTDNGDGTFSKNGETIAKGKIYTNDEVQQKLGGTGGTYTGTWTVIGVEGDSLKLASTKNLGNCTLGSGDPGAISNISAANENSPTREENIRRALWSWENAINTLNMVAQEATGINSARSITAEDIFNILGIEITGSDYGTIRKFYFTSTSRKKVCSRKRIGTDDEGNAIWGDEEYTISDKQMFRDLDGNLVTIDADNRDIQLEFQDNSIYCKLSTEQQAKLGWLGSGGSTYWLGNALISTDEFGVGWNAGFFENDYSSACVASRSLYNSSNFVNSEEKGVRGVIYY